VSSAEMLPAFMDQLARHMMANPGEIDVIIVANETVQTLDHVVHHVRNKYPWLKFEVLQRTGTKRNFGALARFGIAYSTSKYVVLVSPSGEDDVSIIAKMLGKIRKGPQVVQAISEVSKADSNGQQVKFNAYRSIYRLFAKLLVGVEIKSATNRFKMFDRVFVQALGLTQNGHSICPEITFKVLLAGGNVEYVPSNFKSAPINRDFKLYKEGIGYFWLLVRGLAHRAGVLWF
jgi:hypothetical protein